MFILTIYLLRMPTKNQNSLSVEELYNKAVNIRHNKNYKEILKKFKCVVNSNEKYSYPEDYDPYFAIELYFNNNGIELWENSKNYAYINEWLNKCPYTLLQHPVTGDTIFHLNPNIIQICNQDYSLNYVQNFSGVSVLYKSLMQVNFY